MRLRDALGRGVAMVWVAANAGVAHATYHIEFYLSYPAFVERLQFESLRTIDFDDVATNPDSNGFTAFASDRYLASHGVAITGEDGQYASQGFVFPGDYVAVSGPNTYAPGPIAQFGAPAGSGGNVTDVTFGGLLEAGAVGAFGCWLIDADFPIQGPSSLGIYGAGDGFLGTTGTVSGGSASQLFAGAIAVDDQSFAVVPVITRVRITGGDGWPGVYDNEGVVLDDFVFTAPAPEPSASFAALAGVTALAARVRRAR